MSYTFRRLSTISIGHLLFLTLIVGSSFAQETTRLDALVQRYQAIPPNGNSVTAYFTSDEIAMLQSYFASVKEQPATNKATLGPGVTIFGNESVSGSLVSFETLTPENVNVINSNSGSLDFESCGDINPTDLDQAFVLTLLDGEFYSLEISSGNYTFLGNISPPVGENWNGLEFDPATNILYGISANFVDSSTLSIIDIENLSATAIGKTGVNGAIAIATDGDGNFYSYDVIDDSLYSIDTATGQGTLIGSIGFDANFGQDLEWDPNTETMFMTAINSGDDFAAELRTVDLETGLSTFSGTIANGPDSQMPWSSIPELPLLGDVNRDGVVDLLDVAPFVALIVDGVFDAIADINGDGVVDLLDVQPFVDLLEG